MQIWRALDRINYKYHYFIIYAAVDRSWAAILGCPFSLGCPAPRRAASGFGISREYRRTPVDDGPALCNVWQCHFWRTERVVILDEGGGDSTNLVLRRLFDNPILICVDGSNTLFSFMSRPPHDMNENWSNES